MGTPRYGHAVIPAEVQALWGAGSEGKSTVPVLSINRTGSNTFTLDRKGWPGLTFKLQASDSLTSPQWLGSTFRATDQNGQATFGTGIVQPSTSSLFFRAVEVPYTLGGSCVQRFTRLPSDTASALPAPNAD